MIATVWRLARFEALRWWSSPVTLATALLPALGLGGLVAAMAATLGLQPVVLVQEGHGPQAAHMAKLLAADGEAYALTEASRALAAEALWQERAAAVLVIPADFDQALARGHANVDLVLNNVVDVDLADDIRRTVTRSLAEFDAPQLGVIGERRGAGQVVLPNPFRVAIAEHDLRETDVGFLAYQLVPILVLVLLSVGVLGTSLQLARELETGTARLSLAASVSPLLLVLGKLLGSGATTALLVTPLLAGAVLSQTLAVPPGHWPALVALLGATSAVAVALGILLGLAVRRSELTALAGLNGVACLFFLGGGFTTVPFLPPWLQQLSWALPTSYAISGLRQVLFYPDLLGVGIDLAVVAGAAALSLGLAIWALQRAWETP